jgi:hypothetical protein
VAAYHKTITIAATAKSAYELLYGAALPTDGRDVTFRGLSIQGEAAGAAMAIGGDATVTITDYGILIPATSVVVFNLGSYFAGPVRLSDIFIIGTVGNKLHLFGILN